MSEATIEEQRAKVRKRIEQLHALRARLDVAERSLAADASGDWATYIAAMTAELESWDTYLERLQTTAATRGWHAREQAEAEIRDVRSRRIAVDERLVHMRDAAGKGWQEQRERVSAARDELERKADALSAKLH